jgi:crotonobetainyl-CoA:carnitine CoA-transferase CaiB-like acyl-CoA transferase
MSLLPGHDLNIAGLSGLLQLSKDQPPSMPGLLMGDYAGGVMALVGILSAVIARQTSGLGAVLDVSMLDALIGWTGAQMSGTFARAAGSAEAAGIEGWGGNPRYNLYRAKDGRYLTVSLLEKKFWILFCRHVGREDLIDPDETEADRLTSHGVRGELYRENLTRIFATRNRDTWASEMRAHGIPICPVLTPDEVYAAAPSAERGWFSMQNVARLGGLVPQMGFPFRMQLANGASCFAMTSPPPELGDANADLERGGALWSS